METDTAAARDHDDRVFQHVLGLYDAPAYVRRGRHVREVLEQLLARCRRQRDDWLAMVRVRLALLYHLAGDWPRLRPWLADDKQIDLLRQLYTALTPRLRVSVEPASSGRTLPRALGDLVESIAYFNRRWRAFLRGVDLTHLNAARDGYNRYYLLEKECAIRSARVARQHFEQLEPFTLQELEELLPPLPMPRLKE